MPAPARNRLQQALASCCVLSTLAIGYLAAQQPAQKAVPIPPIRIAGGAQLIINGQIVVGQGAEPGKDSSSQRVKLPVDPRARRKIEEARRFIETQDWQSAVMILQSLLNANEDNFLQESENDKGRRVSVRAEANRLLGSLPPEGKRIYEQQFGSAAKQELKLAKAQANPQLMANVALKYVHTESGAEAAAWLGAYHLDHGRYIVAALCFERLLTRDVNGAGVTLSTLYKAALAFERSGDTANMERTWKLIQARLNLANERLPAAIRSWDENRLKNALKIMSAARTTTGENEWRLFMGSPDRAAHSNSTAPFLEPRFPAFAPVEPGQARNEIEQASKKLFSMGVPVIPGNHPLIVRDMVVYRALDGVHAFNLKSGREEWRSLSDASLFNAMRNQGSSDPEAQNYLANYRETAQTILLENTLLGTLSADHELVYGVEDLAVPPNVQSFGAPWFRGNRFTQPQSSSLGDFGGCNHLLAFDLEGGRVVWSIGTRLSDQPFSDMFFLGPPLPLGDKLYVLAEVNAEIRLLCLQNRKTAKPNARPGDEFDYGVDLVWSQPLGVVDRKITEDPVRRTQAAMLAYSDGILVCPTNAGSVIGVDLLTRSLVWAFSYQNEVVATDTESERMNFRALGRQHLPREPFNKGSQWCFAAPVISQGKVLLAPSDGTALHAVNLRDGTLAWSINRVDTTSKEPSAPDCYLAGVHDKLVLLAGKINMRAVDLNTGKQVWNTVTGTPCGRGIANNETYFLPVRGNELLSIDINSGKILTRAKARHKELMGNLALIGEHFVSLGQHHLLAYPIQAVKERQVAERLKVNPSDPAGLVDRGDLRWHRGELQNAIQDFRTAISSNPAPELKTKAEAKLADSLLSMLEKDFVKNESFLPDLERLTVPVSLDVGNADERQTILDRKARFYRMLAKGRESQGRIDEALASYQAFAQLDDKLIVSPDDPLVRILPKVWAIAQSQAMAKRLPPKLKGQLDSIVQRQWDKVKGDKNDESLKSFIEFYGELTRVGQDAQLVYADTLMNQRDFATALLRLLPLLEAKDVSIAARAHDSVARLNVRLGELENAAYYYRLLARRYPKITVRDGKTGEQLLKELSTDKRFLPYLDERQGLSNLQNISVEKLEFSRKYGNNYNQFSFVANFDPVSELPPSLRRFQLRVSMDMQNASKCSYSVIDQLLKKETLTKWNFARGTINYGYQERIWPVFQPYGNVMVFNWADRVVGIDPLEKKEVWSVNVLGETASSFDSNQGGFNLLPVPDMPGRFQILHHNSSQEVLGSYGAGSSRRLLVSIRHEGLVCLHPQTGEKLWTRYGIPASVEIFGDDEYAVILPAKTGRSLEDQPLAIRMQDGQIIPLKADVENQARSALSRHGRTLLCRVQINADQDELQLKDPVLDQVIWRKSLPTKAATLTSALPSDHVGVLFPDSQLSIMDLSTGSTIFQSKLKVPYQTYQAAHYIMDDKECYVFLCKEKKQTLTDGEKTLFSQFQWLRSIPVNGPAICLARDSGTTLWQEEIPLSYLVTQRFHELPVLLCSSVSMKTPKPINVNNLQVQQLRGPNFVIRANTGRLSNELSLFSKLSGKAVPLPGGGLQEQGSGYEGRVPNVGGFQELSIDSQTGKIEMKSAQQSMSFMLVPQTMTARQK